MGARGYGVFDLAFAALYVYLGFVIAPSRMPAFQLALGVVALLLFVAGLGLVGIGENAGFARWFAIVACTVLLAFALVVVVLLAASASFLLGVYGALGRGVGMLALVAALLVIELCGLLPLFQLRFHLRKHRAPS